MGTRWCALWSGKRRERLTVIAFALAAWRNLILRVLERQLRELDWDQAE